MFWKNFFKWFFLKNFYKIFFFNFLLHWEPWRHKHFGAGTYLDTVTHKAHGNQKSSKQHIPLLFWSNYWLTNTPEAISRGFSIFSVLESKMKTINYASEERNRKKPFFKNISKSSESHSCWTIFLVFEEYSQAQVDHIMTI